MKCELFFGKEFFELRRLKIKEENGAPTKEKTQGIPSFVILMLKETKRRSSIIFEEKR